MQSEQKMPKETLKDLEELSMNFAENVGSEALFKVFLEIAEGYDYITKIAHRLEKSKAIVSRQVKELVRTRLVRQKGEGVKKTFYVDWEVFTYYWISTFSPALSMAGDIFEMTEGILTEARVPKWMGGLYLSPKEWKEIENKKIGKRKISAESILEERLLPVISSLAPIVETLVRISARIVEPRNFVDTFFALSRSFAIGLPDLGEMDIKLEEIEDEETKQLFTALYSDEVRLWLKINVFYDVYGANLVRNFVFDKLGLLKKRSR